MGKGLASLIACCYPELQALRNLPINNFPPGSSVTYFDQQHQRFIYNLVTKRRFFHKPTYETLELSPHALKQHLERHNICELAIPKLSRARFDSTVLLNLVNVTNCFLDRL